MQTFPVVGAAVCTHAVAFAIYRGTPSDGIVHQRPPGALLITILASTMMASTVLCTVLAACMAKRSAGVVAYSNHHLRQGPVSVSCLQSTVLHACGAAELGRVVCMLGVLCSMCFCGPW